MSKYVSIMFSTFINKNFNDSEPNLLAFIMLFVHWCLYFCRALPVAAGL